MTISFDEEEMIGLGKTLLHPPINHNHLLYSLKEFFELVFENLSSVSAGFLSPFAFGVGLTGTSRLLEIFRSQRLAVLMLNLQLDRLAVRLFRYFLTAADPILSCEVLFMAEILTSVVEESEKYELTFELVGLLVTCQKKENLIASPIRWQLGAKVLKNCANRLKPHIPKLVRGMGIALHDYSITVASICNNDSENEAMAQSSEISEDLVGKKILVWHSSLEVYQIAFLKSFDSMTKIQKVSYAYCLGTREILNLNMWGLHEDKSLMPASEEFDSDGSDDVQLTSQEMTPAQVQALPRSSSCDDSPMASNSVTKVKGKRKRDNVPSKEQMAQVQVLLRSDSCDDPPMASNSVTKVKGKRKRDNVLSKEQVLYEAGGKEVLNLNTQTWEFVENVSSMPDSSSKENANHLMETKRTTNLVKESARMDMTEICAELLDAQEKFVKAKRCVKVLDLVKKKLNKNILESIALVKRTAQKDLRERCAELVNVQERFEKTEMCVKVLHLVEENLNNLILKSNAQKGLVG